MTNDNTTLKELYAKYSKPNMTREERQELMDKIARERYKLDKRKPITQKGQALSNLICGIVIDFLGYDGAFTAILVNMGVIKEKVDLLTIKSAFRPIFVLSGTWQGIGYGSIIYLAALSGVDQELFEAAKIDGAGRWRQTLHITIPSIAPTIIIMFILTMGNLLNVSMEKIILLYRPVTYDTADVISSFVYRRGLQEGAYGYSTAVGLFNSIVNMALMFTTNAISAKYSETSLF